MASITNEEEWQILQALLDAASLRRDDEPTQPFKVHIAPQRTVMMLRTRIISFLQNIPDGISIQEVIDALLENDDYKEILKALDQ